MLVFLCPAGFSEEEEKLEEQLEKNGFRLVARLTGIPSGETVTRGAGITAHGRI